MIQLFIAKYKQTIQINSFLIELHELRSDHLKNLLGKKDKVYSSTQNASIGSR